MRPSALYRGALHIRMRRYAVGSVLCESSVSAAATAPHHRPQYSPHLLRHQRPRQVAFLSTEARPSSKSNEITSKSSSSSLQKTDDDDSSSVPEVSNYTPIDFETCAKIEGEESHIVTIDLRPGECVRAESGSMVFMTESVRMNATLAGASGAFKRMLTGQNVFLTDFTCEPSEETQEKKGQICLGTDFPSKIIRLNLQDMANETLICQRGAYLASNPTVEIDMEFTKSLSAGFFGGQGFVLQRLSGEGDVLIKAGGTLVAKELLPGETLRVTSGSIVAFESTNDYDVQMMPGIKNAFFAGEGLFVTKLTGPGRVWLQGLPPDRMISEIARRVPGPGVGLGIPIGMRGGEAGGADEAGADETGATEGGGEDVSEQVAATDSSIDADRQATVASSGMMDGDGGDSEAMDDPNSPSALFGDAAPDKDVGGPSDDASFATNSTEPTFGMEDEESSISESTIDEPTFDDGSSFSSDDDDFSQQEGEFFGGDPGTTTDLGSDAASEEGGSSLLGTLWDLFMGGDE